MSIRAAYRRNRFIILLIGAVVVVHGVAYAHILRNFPAIADSEDTQYSSIAEHLVREGVYSVGARDAAGRLLPTGTQPPLYPLLYAASYRVFGIGSAAHEPMRILLMLANIGVIVVSWRIGALFSARAANAAALFAALDGTAFYFANHYNIPDTLLGLFMSLWLLFFVRFLRGGAADRHLFLGTVFLGCAMMTKIAPFLLWVPLAVFLAAFLWRSVKLSPAAKVRMFGVFALVIVVFFGGWKVRNAIAVGGSVFASGATTLQQNAAYLLMHQQGISRPAARAQLAERYFPPELIARGEVAVEREGGRAVARVILGSPIDFAIVTLRAMPGFFFGTFPPYVLFSRATADALQAAVQESHGNRALLPRLWSEGRLGYIGIYALAKLHLLLLYGAAAVAAVVFIRRREFRWILALFLLTIAYTVAVSGAAAQARYRTMIFPIFYVLGGYGAQSVSAWASPA